jgi:hypothetical protein
MAKYPGQRGMALTLAKMGGVAFNPPNKDVRILGRNRYANMEDGGRQSLELVVESVKSRRFS